MFRSDYILYININHNVKKSSRGKFMWTSDRC